MPDLADEQPLFTAEEIDAFIAAVYEKSVGTNQPDSNRITAYANKFGEALALGYGKTIGEVDYNSPDADMLRSLRENIFHFSTAKNKTEILALRSLLIDEQGKPRTFESFRAEASNVLGEFQGNWMRAEYDLALNASTMASRWVQLSADSESVLIYRTVGDSRVRESHRLLNGVARPVGDSFWDTFYPPNGWNCRCDVEKTFRKAPTPEDQLPLGAIDDVPPMFRSNFAKQGLLFPKNHPYFKADG